MYEPHKETNMSFYCTVAAGIKDCTEAGAVDMAYLITQWHLAFGSRSSSRGITRISGAFRMGYCPELLVYYVYKNLTQKDLLFKDFSKVPV